MRGHVRTPDEIAERVVRQLFRDNPPTTGDRILYPGCGDAPFAAAVERVCNEKDWPVPDGYGVEINPEHLQVARQRDLSHFNGHKQDFLRSDMLDAGKFEYIVGNPPYVPIEDLTEDEKSRYRSEFSTASGRFDLYLLFFERALSMLAENGRLSFITPEKFEYVDTAAPLRRLLTSDTFHVEEINHIPEDTFSGLVTFPCVTTVCRETTDQETVVKLRDGSSHTTSLPGGGSWAASVRNSEIVELQTGVTLDDITERISPGLATGADNVFVMEQSAVPESIPSKWVRPTVSGKQLREYDGPYTDSVFLCPYHDDGELASENELSEFYDWLTNHRGRLEDRSCVLNGKTWYAWREAPPMNDILQPKIVFRDIAKKPKFWSESDGNVIPKHSVYYAVPQDRVPVNDLIEYLNSTEARMWMEANCQKAHNGYYRLQSRVLSELPVPKELAESYQATLRSK